jgi:hypothetical protein
MDDDLTSQAEPLKNRDDANFHHAIDEGIVGQDKQKGSTINLGNIEGVTGLAIGNGASVVIQQAQPAAIANFSDSAIFTKYLELLQVNLLKAFRQDYYVSLNVETRDSEDCDTLGAIQEALHSTFGIKVAASSEETSRHESLEIAVAPHRLVALLGDPGIGKTTSLRSVALKQIAAWLDHPKQLIPVWISLGKWHNKNIPAAEFIWQQIVEILGDDRVEPAVVEQMLTEGKMVLYLDGLNELPQRELEGQQVPALPPIQKNDRPDSRHLDPRENSLLLIARNSNSRFLMSCRTFEYAHLSGWHEFRILPLQEEQIEDFVQKHLGVREKRFRQMLDSQAGLNDLIRNPFYLRSLIRLVQEDRQQIGGMSNPV